MSDQGNRKPKTDCLNSVTPTNKNCLQIFDFLFFVGSLKILQMGTQETFLLFAFELFLQLARDSEKWKKLMKPSQSKENCNWKTSSLEKKITEKQSWNFDNSVESIDRLQPQEIYFVMSRICFW